MGERKEGRKDEAVDSFNLIRNLRCLWLWETVMVDWFVWCILMQQPDWEKFFSLAC